MAQIFVFGSSSAHGVGGSIGGWADLLKRHLHGKMYGENGIGEKHRLYNFAKPGATVSFVRETFADQLKHYRGDGRNIAIVLVGGNNAKAEDAPDQFVSSVEEFSMSMLDLLQAIRRSMDQVLVVGFRAYDETKTLPKPNPLTGGKSYFWNARTELFDMTLRKVCEEVNATYIDLRIPSAQWIAEYLYSDGLHANDKGHEAIFREILAELDLGRA